MREIWNCGLLENLTRSRVCGFTYSKCCVIFPRRRLPIIPVGGSRFIPNASNAFYYTFVAWTLGRWRHRFSRYSTCKRIKKKWNKEKVRVVFLPFSFSAKKLAKQVERLQVQLSEEKSRNRELSAQLAEAADYKARNFRESVLSYNQINPNMYFAECGTEFCRDCMTNDNYKNNTLPAFDIYCGFSSYYFVKFYFY